MRPQFPDQPAPSTCRHGAGGFVFPAGRRNLVAVLAFAIGCCFIYVFCGARSTRFLGLHDSISFLVPLTSSANVDDLLAGGSGVSAEKATLVDDRSVASPDDIVVSENTNQSIAKPPEELDMVIKPVVLSPDISSHEISNPVKNLSVTPPPPVGDIDNVTSHLSTKAATRDIKNATALPPTSVTTNITNIMDDPEELRLNEALKKAAMVDKTVVLTIVNSAWTKPGSILDIFMASIRKGERTRKFVNHLIIVAMDQDAYLRCLEVHHNCYALMTEGVDFSGQKDFMSDGYLKLVWRKVDFQRIVLQKGYDFIFSDADIMWFRDPLPNLSPEGDIQLSCDRYYDSTSGWPNVGFHYARSNTRTIEFYNLWHSSRLQHPNQKTQEVLNSIKNGPFVKNSGLKIIYLDTTYFGGLCEPSKDFNKVCTMHANCCIGLDNKIKDLKRLLGDWKRFVTSPPSVNGSHLATWTAPHSCR